MIDPNETARAKMLAGMEAVRDSVAAFTGMKQQFIDAGWTPAGAEGMVIAILRQNASIA